MTDTATLSLLFRIGTAERQLENLDVPGDVLDRIADDISDGAATTEGSTCLPMPNGVEHHGQDS